MTRLVLALPSKGRLKEQAESWLADAGFGVSQDGGERGYQARLSPDIGVDVRLMSASEIAAALSAGDIHLGVTGEDLLRESVAELEARVQLAKPLGFGKAKLVVAVPEAWLDVSTMADLEDVAHEIEARQGRRLRVATKYLRQTRAFFAGRGVTAYRLVESAGATEGAPAAGTADVIVDITTTGSTLAANRLKILEDGLILSSQAQLAAARQADWSVEARAALKRLLDGIEARAKARAVRTVTVSRPLTVEESQGLIGQFGASFQNQTGEGAVSFDCPKEDVLAAVSVLERLGAGTLRIFEPDYVFETVNPVYQALISRL